MNLHQLTRGPLAAVAREKPASLWRMTGEQVRGERGDLQPVFEGPTAVRAQWQSISPDAVILTEKVPTASTVRRVYLHAGTDPAARPWAQWRPLGRSGDLLEDADGLFWLATAVIEDFSGEGWACLQVVLQTVRPKFIARSPDGH